MGEYMLAMGTVRQDVTVYAFGANFVEAVFNATGKRVRALPIRSEKLL
jgi:CO/xanthine dehydrogenase Mo-binding subunit